jgi:hypothetical protein
MVVCHIVCHYSIPAKVAVGTVSDLADIIQQRPIAKVQLAVDP